MQILLNISRSKGSKPLKFGQVIEYTNRNTFLQKSHRKSDIETKKALFEAKLSGLQLSFNHFE